MMDLSAYIEPCKEIPVTGFFVPLADTLGYNLVKTNYQVAIIGVPFESDKYNLGISVAPDAIRRQLYELSYNFKGVRIADLGNIKVGDSFSATTFVLESVLEALHKDHIIPIVLGGSHDLTLAMKESLKKRGESARALVIDSLVDIRCDEEVYAQNFLQKMDVPLSILGLQNYYCTALQMSQLATRDCFCMRLSEMISDKARVEAVCRDSDLFSLDMSSVRQSELPGRAVSIPNGLSGVEACQVAYYAGVSDAMKSYGVFGCNPTTDSTDQSAALAAQIVWHLLLGIDQRRGDYPVRPIDRGEYSLYKVLPDEGNSEEVLFYTNHLNDRWWVKIPTQEGVKIFACTQKDYEDMCRHNIPDIWMRNFMK